MTLFEISSILLTLAALFSYLNFRYIRLPTTVGIMSMSIAGSLLLLVLGRAFPSLHAQAARVMAGIDFQQAVFHGMLALLLFAGSLHLDLGDLRRECGVISLLAAGGMALSTAVVAGLSWLAFRGLGVGVTPVECLLFGALISPTDPIAVLAIMKSVRAPKDLETQLAGESLFNDGIGVVIFLTALELSAGGAAPSWHRAGLLLLREVGGGAAVGLAAGLFVYRLLKRVDNYQVEVLLTLALATGGFTLAEALHVSAPIAVVVAGLFIGNPGRSFAMSRTTEEHLDAFWELLDEILNALLFLLIGLELLVVQATPRLLLPGLAALGIALLARLLSVAASVGLVRLWRPLRPGTVAVLTWGGLRGGLSVAMALSLPEDRHRGFLVTMTYGVVVFSVLAQGLTFGPLVRKITSGSRSDAS